MQDAFMPASTAELAAFIGEAAACRTPLSICGSASKASLGQPNATEKTVSLGALSGINFYEPEELVLSARAGTPLAEIRAVLAAHGQELAFEPMDPGFLLGTAEGQGTLGGLIATNLAGPRRLKAGAARDHVLGVTAINGRGEVFRAGGRVVKNVTGYDLPRALCGSFGTLAVLTDITLKVLPAGQDEVTLMVEGLDSASAIQSLNTVLGTSADLSAAAHIEANSNTYSRSRTLFRIEGFTPSVKDRVNRVKEFAGACVELQRGESRALWADVRDVKVLGDAAGRLVWKLAVTPGRAPEVVAAVRKGVPDLRVLYDWGGGLVWLSLPGGEAQAALIRAAIAAHGGGHAMLFAAPRAVRETVDVFQPEAPALVALAQRLKAAFDPAGIFEPGRMMREP